MTLSRLSIEYLLDKFPFTGLVFWTPPNLVLLPVQFQTHSRLKINSCSVNKWKPNWLRVVNLQYDSAVANLAFDF